MENTISRPTSSDWSVPTVKCRKCGAMFNLDSDNNDQTVTCPICNEKQDLKTAHIIDASNEEF
jgi:DNA-directed RNA polymerase subunit RPC12/RpoP